MSDKNVTKKKTPSPRVVAAMAVLARLNEPLDPANLSEIADSRVNDAKSEKVRTHMDKLVGKLKQRLEKIVEKFHNPPPSTRKAPPGFGKKK